MPVATASISTSGEPAGSAAATASRAAVVRTLGSSTTV